MRIFDTSKREKVEFSPIKDGEWELKNSISIKEVAYRATYQKAS